jgi:hypothetical protein
VIANCGVREFNYAIIFRIRGRRLRGRQRKVSLPQAAESGTDPRELSVRAFFENR